MNTNDKMTMIKNISGDEVEKMTCNLLAICIMCVRGLELTCMPRIVFTDEDCDPNHNTCVVAYTMCNKCRDEYPVVVSDGTETGSHTTNEILRMTMSTHLCRSLKGEKIAAWMGYDDVIWERSGFVAMRKIMLSTTTRTDYTSFSVLSIGHERVGSVIRTGNQASGF